MAVESKDVGDETVIWRYMDFTKFAALLNSRCLFFTRADRFADVFEGSLTRPDIVEVSDIDIDAASQNYSDMKRFLVDRFRYFTFLNCWHMNDVESAAMWQLYLRSSDGIAIRSSVARLKTALASFEDKIIIRPVRYIDYDTERIEMGDMLEPFFYKRRSFEHERELRAVFFDVRLYHDGTSPTMHVNLEHPEHEFGIPVAIDPTTLLESVYVAPQATDWFRDLVIALSAKFDLTCSINQSRLDDPRLR